MPPDIPLRFTTFPAPARWATSGERVELSWEQAVRLLDEAELWPGGGTVGHARDRLPGLSFAVYKNDSRVPAPGEPADAAATDRVEAVWGLMVEYTSDPTVDAPQLESRWGSWRFLAYTAAFHQQPDGERPAGPRWRLLLPFSKAVTAEEAVRVGQWARHPRRRAGVVDVRTEDPARQVPRPALNPGGFEQAAHDGPVLDPGVAMEQLRQWQEADRLERARAMLKGTRLVDAAYKLAERRDGRMPWPPHLDPGVALRPGTLVVLTGDAAGWPRTFALAMARHVATRGHPALCVSTAVTLSEVLARLLALDDPELPWRALADGVDDKDRITGRAEALGREAPGLHVWHPDPDSRTLSALRDQWRALCEETASTGLIIIDDPVDLAPEGADVERGLGLQLHDLAATTGRAGAETAVVVVTSERVAARWPADLWLHIGAEGIVVRTSDGPRSSVPVRMDPLTGALRRIGRDRRTTPESAD